MTQRPIIMRKTEKLQQLPSCSKYCALLPVTYAANEDCADKVLVRSVVGEDVVSEAEGAKIPWSCFVGTTATFAVTSA